MPGFRLLRRARTDLLDIAAYTADRWGDAQAERYLTGLYSGFQTIVDRPELRRPFAEIPPYFRALVGKHAAPAPPPRTVRFKSLQRKTRSQLLLTPRFRF